MALACRDDVRRAVWSFSIFETGAVSTGVVLRGRQKRGGGCGVQSVAGDKGLGGRVACCGSLRAVGASVAGVVGGTVWG